MNTEPRQKCEKCGRIETVKPDGRGFPPDIAKRKLAKRCERDGHHSQPIYTPGLSLGGLATGQ